MKDIILAPICVLILLLTAWSAIALRDAVKNLECSQLCGCQANLGCSCVATNAVDCECTNCTCKAALLRTGAAHHKCCKEAK